MPKMFIKKTVLSIFLLVFLTDCADFSQKAKPLFKDLVTLYELSLTKCQTTQNVWATAIYDRKYALSTPDDDDYVSDFNQALL